MNANPINQPFIHVLLGWIKNININDIFQVPDNSPILCFTNSIQDQCPSKSSFICWLFLNSFKTKVLKEESSWLAAGRSCESRDFTWETAMWWRRGFLAMVTSLWTTALNWDIKTPTSFSGGLVNWDSSRGNISSNFNWINFKQSVFSVQSVFLNTNNI